MLVGLGLTILAGYTGWLANPTWHASQSASIVSSQNPEMLDPIESAMSSLTLRQKVGQLFMSGFRGSTTDANLEAWLAKKNLGGVILFRDNIRTETQLEKLTESIKKLPQTLPFIAIDQEGGPVNRISWDLTAEAGQRQIGSETEAQNIAKKRGAFLQGLGINLNLAPVVDVATQATAGMWYRAFSAEPGERGAAMVRGYRAAGIEAVVKHFPSFGNYSGDVEATIPTKTFSASEQQSFQVALADAHLLMVSPIIASNLDDQSPAPISKPALDYVRETLSFDGVIITDDVEMPSVRAHYSPAKFAVQAFEAGADILLFATHPEDMATAYKAILKKCQTSPVWQAKLDAAVRRILKIKLDL